MKKTKNKIIATLIISMTIVIGLFGFYNQDQIACKIFSTSASCSIGEQAFNEAYDASLDRLTLQSDLVVNDNYFKVGTSYLVVNGTNTSVGGGLSVSEQFKVSTNTATGYSLCLVGAVDSLPTSGYNEGCFIYNITNHTVYISTENVVGQESWKALW